ncbi:MAG: hypothetical protein HY365_00040 [Candidatus Aenigmarchaeota archaeon]|nr:hypothetical protein [Candidatus Aenigmarchaeota archaeon]
MTTEETSFEARIENLRKLYEQTGLSDFLKRNGFLNPLDYIRVPSPDMPWEAFAQEVVDAHRAAGLVRNYESAALRAVMAEHAHTQYSLYTADTRGDASKIGSLKDSVNPGVQLAALYSKVNARRN